MATGLLDLKAKERCFGPKYDMAQDDIDWTLVHRGHTSSELLATPVSRPLTDLDD